jgi:hypothetical protein
MPKVPGAAKFLLDTGLLAEINRLVLHPRGLALPVNVEDDGQVAFVDYLLKTDDPEGMEMGHELLKEIREKLTKAPPISTTRLLLFMNGGVEPLYRSEGWPTR